MNRQKIIKKVKMKKQRRREKGIYEATYNIDVF
jgi:hypothetical protein